MYKTTLILHHGANSQVPHIFLHLMFPSIFICDASFFVVVLGFYLFPLPPPALIAFFFYFIF